LAKSFTLHFFICENINKDYKFDFRSKKYIFVQINPNEWKQIKLFMIEFILNNQVIKTTAPASITLVDFIRENKQLKGTKIACREGDCGVCTVLVGTLQGEKVSYQSITSCISPLGMHTESTL
jgi:hypothetical protein